MIPSTIDRTIWDELPTANVDTAKLEHLFESRAKDMLTKVCVNSHFFSYNFVSSRKLNSSHPFYFKCFSFSLVFLGALYLPISHLMSCSLFKRVSSSLFKRKLPEIL